MMHIHAVFFWLKSDLDCQAAEAFERGLDALIKDPEAITGHYGKPADTHRDVTERTYSYGLVLAFDDLAAHDRYQKGAPHREFVEDHAAKWERVVVHDIETIQ